MFRRFFRTLFGGKMSSTEQELEMLDILAFNCTQVVNKLRRASKCPEEQNVVLQEHIQKMDKELPAIKDFKDDMDWFNVTEPLSFHDTLKGKVVILDFFTYCCINCMHILPDLKRLEQRYSIEDGLVVIGVHSAKFDNEKDSANILSAVQRYDITHPVVNDNLSSMWIDLKIKCWPTLLILGPKANPLFVVMGEGQYEITEKYVDAALKYYRKTGEIKNHSLPINPSTDLIMSSNLKFPGKIVSSKATYPTSDFEGEELFAISDSGNHRIIVLRSNGEVVYKIGGKTSGFNDGDFDSVRFNAPQGVTFLNNNIIFVADTENHAIRKIDLVAMKVETVVGTGIQGTDRIGNNPGIEQEISSPWDVVAFKSRDMDMSFHIDESTVQEKDVILIAMAGTHQIWCYFVDDLIWWKFKQYPKNICVAIAGNGNEENRNNSYPQNSAFAQPSGLAINRELKELYIADSESSCVRKLMLQDGKVSGIVGGDRNPQNLFAFGDVDGKQFQAKLQHPLGVAFNPKDNYLYVADTYNHKIKKIDVNTSTVTTCKITDQSGEIFQFNEPGGMCLNNTGDTLFVADTNNHTIECVDLDTMKTKPLKLQFNVVSNGQNLGTQFECTELKMKPHGGNIHLTIALVLDEKDVHITLEAPQAWAAFMPNTNWNINQNKGCLKSNELGTSFSKLELDVVVPGNSLTQDQKLITISFKLNLCKKDICFPKTFALVFPVIHSDEGQDSIMEDVIVKISKESIQL